MFTLIENGEVYGPEPCGQKAVLLVNDRIAIVGTVDRSAMLALGVPCDVIDASGCLVIPGLIDPHEHLLGGSGEQGFNTQTPEVYLHEIVTAGITTVVGCLGVDTTMKTLPGLLAKVKALREEGMSAYMYTGGYNIPPTTVLASPREDLLFLDEVIGIGEIAIADDRSTDPQPHELARVASEAYVGGLLNNKAGVSHFHVGPCEQRLAVLWKVLDDYNVQPAWIYPTHIERSEVLMQEAIALAHRGSFVDIDTVEEDLPQWLQFYINNDGDLGRLTVSSDASISSPRTLFEQIRTCIRDYHLPLVQVLPLVTANTAAVLKLPRKGRLAPGNDADVLVLRQRSLDIVHVIARGRCMVRDGELVVKERFLTNSNRRVSLYGQNA